MKIQILPADVVNQIAAGEVVERPAHLVKELIENSIDAGATTIDVEVERGGRFIKVRDNGRGMAADELALALARHATSKIAQYDDLWNLASFGFRGEALASAAAVSRLTLVSKTSGSETGAKIVSEFGQLSEVTPSGGEEGTTVTISDLFENVPARLKFLKSEAGEIAQIKTVLKALAVCHPNVQFRVRLKGKLAAFWPAEPDLRMRAEQVMEFSPLYEIVGNSQGINVRILFSSPNQTVGHSRQIWQFVQNRWVQDRTLNAAVLESYRNLLMHGEYPVVLVWTDVDPDTVDVNVSPTKSQVKFQNASAVFRIVAHTLRQGLERAPWLKELLPGVEPRELQSSPPTATLVATGGEPTSQPLMRTQFKKTDFTGIVQTLKNYAPTTFVKDTSAALATPTPKAQPKWAHLQVLGQTHLTYIMAESESALFLVDQHAAHERVNFEKLLTGFKDNKMEVQDFLLPLTVTLPEDQVEAVLAQSGELQKLGLYLDQMGPTVVGVRAAPALIQSEALTPVIEKMAIEIVENGGSFALEKKAADILATMACHSSVRAGQVLSLPQMQSLLAQMDEFPLSTFCPHGRPVYVEYSYSQIEREFGRTV